MPKQKYYIRTYRKQFNTHRFSGFQISLRETDLWIGVNPDSFHEKMKDCVLSRIKELRENLDKYINTEPLFAKSLEPFQPSENAPSEAKEMALASAKAGIGPMAAVAAVFAREAGKTILQNFPVKELIIENGGDIFANLKNNLIISIFAGESPLSGKTGIEIPGETGKLGICTSSGTVGPSMSFGKADAVMVICNDILIADALATAIGNEVKAPADIERALKISEKYPEIRSILIICKDKLGIRGEFQLKSLK